MTRRRRSERWTILQCEHHDSGNDHIGIPADQRNCRLKLKVYRSLGIDVQANGAGNYNKAVIRNNQKGDVHIINVDPKFSKFFYSSYFWQTMQ